MDKPKLYGDRRSGNCYKPALLLTLLDRPFHWVDVDVMAAETRTREFLAMNPNGRVPLLQLADGRYLAESNAMLLHLAEGTEFLPDDAYQRALVYQWLFFEQYSHEPFIAVARFIVLYAGREKVEADRLVQLRQKGNEALQVTEEQLAKTPFLAGEEFTIADIALFAYTHVASDGGFDLEPCQNVRNWLTRVHEVPGFEGMGGLSA
ncbi:glutathione S-transferase family protein [Pseudomonadota bacterium]